MQLSVFKIIESDDDILFVPSLEVDDGHDFPSHGFGPHLRILCVTSVQGLAIHADLSSGYHSWCKTEAAIVVKHYV